MQADNITRGPRRWERAALNAVRRPHSQAAALYRSRVAIATEISESASVVIDVRTPWEFIADSYSWEYVPTIGRWGTVNKGKKRQYVTCSLYCTVMQLTLDKASVDKSRLMQGFDPRDNGTYARPVATKVNRRCQVCGSLVVRR